MEGRSHLHLLQDLALIGATKALLSGFVIAAGFHGISDDDFSRTVIAQHFAQAPRVSPSSICVDDPSQMSWLPLPFWITGSAMILLGTSLAVARGVGVAFGVVAMWMVYAAAARVLADRKLALIAALVACARPASVLYGAASTPDLAGAAAMTLVVALITTTKPAFVLASVVTFAATLTRYEAWLLVPAVAGLATLAALGGTLPRPQLVAVLALSGAGPLSWLAYNHAAFGDALHFAKVVSDYKLTLQADAPLTRLIEIPRAILLAEPEVLGVFVIAAVVLCKTTALAVHRKALWIFLALGLALTALSTRGGGPTHHVERAVYSMHLYLTIATTALIAAVRRERLVTPLAFIVAAPLSLIRLIHRESVAQRDTEIEMGAALDAVVPRGERVVIAATDFGHFAIQAAFARPGDIHPHDPVAPTLNGTPSTRAVLNAARSRGARFVVGPFNDPPPFAGRIVFCHRGLCVAELNETP